MDKDLEKLHMQQKVMEHKVNTDVMNINNLVHFIHNMNVNVGWWDNIDKTDINVILSKLALCHSELSESLEGFRKGIPDDKLFWRDMSEVELADAVIRIFDLAGSQGFDLQGAIEEKIAYNAFREDHKRENRMKDGGKKA